MSDSELEASQSKWTILRELHEYIEREYQNLCKSRNRARTLEGIQTKQRLLSEALEQFESLVETYESKLRVDDWNKLTDNLEVLKSKVHKSLRILEQTEVIPVQKTRSTETHIFTEIVIPETFPVQNFDESIINEDFPLSSTLKDPESKEDISAGFKEKIEDLKREFLQNSINFGNSINRSKGKMSTNGNNDNSNGSIIGDNGNGNGNIHNGNNNQQPQPQFQFPMQLAIQCIPEFHGSTDELEPFLVQIIYFSDLIPHGVTEKPLLNIVLMKLKGKAAAFINRIKSETWAEMLPKLRNTFSKKISSEEILQKIETLEQGYRESFTEYADRALRIQECIDELQEEQLLQHLQPNQITSFAGKSLRIHFIGGLRNTNLKQVAKSQKVATFKQLIQALELEHKECEQLESIEQRLQNSRTSKNPQFQQNYRSDQRTYNNYNRNQNANNNHRGNVNFDNQRNFRNDRNFSVSSRPTNSGNRQQWNNWNQSQERRNDYQPRDFGQRQNNFRQNSDRCDEYQSRNYSQTQNNRQNARPSNWSPRRFEENNTRPLNNDMTYKQRKN